MIGAEFVPTVGTLLATIPRMHPVFSVKIDIMVTGDQGSGWTNIAHITQGGSMSVPGDRMPLISLFPNENRLHISSYINGNINMACNAKTLLEPNKWVQIEIKQIFTSGRFEYSVTSDSVEFYPYYDEHSKCVLENTTPMEFVNMKVYASDPWNGSPQAKIRNFRFSTTCKTRSFLTKYFFRQLMLG